MEKNEMVTVAAVTTAGIISAILLWLTRLAVYQDAMDNWLFIIMIWIFMLAIGFGISKIFVTEQKGGKKSEKIFDD